MVGASGDGSTVTLIEYDGCKANTEVLFYRINGGGHTWPGGGSIGNAFGVQNQDINTSLEIWKFFSQNPRGNE